MHFVLVVIAFAASTHGSPNWPTVTNYDYKNEALCEAAKKAALGPAKDGIKRKAYCTPKG